MRARPSANGGIPSPAHARRPAADGGDDAPWATSVMEALSASLHGALSLSDEVCELVVCALCSGRHILLDDVPGTGKTTLARALAASVDMTMQRIQFTSDLLPTDLTGVGIYDESLGTFRFHEGPLFANVVVADEINRATPKTQAALLEAMAEGSVSVDGVTHPLPRPFVVISTQNPVEQRGTYPLPEAELDRFALRTSMGYPPRADELALVQAGGAADALAGMRAVCTGEEVLRAQRDVSQAYLGDAVAGYLVDVVRATRSNPDVLLGASPRAAIDLAALCRARALMHGRDYVTPDDVQTLSVPALAHRILMRPGAGGSGAADDAHAYETACQAVRTAVRATPVPRTRGHR